MMTKEEFKVLMDKVAEMYIDNDEMMDELKRAYDEYPENRNVEEGERKRDEDREIRKEDVDWRSKYDDLSRKYRERFFTTPDEVKVAQAEDIRKDGENLSFESLFESREGDYKR